MNDGLLCKYLLTFSYVVLHEVRLHLTLKYMLRSFPMSERAVDIAEELVTCCI